MHRLIPTLALMLAASGSQAAVKTQTLESVSVPTLDPVVAIESGAPIAARFDLEAALLLAQGPRGPGDGPDRYGPPGGPDRYGPRGGPDPYGPPGGPGFRPGPGPGPRPYPPPPPDPGPAGIIPHLLPLLLPPPRP